MTKKLAVQWRGGYRAAIDATDAYSEIERIRKQNGGSATAGLVVEAARRKTNKLHPAFTWDDRIAAEEHRLEEARCLMRSLVVIRPESPKFPTRVYEVQRVQFAEPAECEEESVNAYFTLEDVLADPAMRADLLKRALAELVSCKRKYSQLKELSAVWNELDNVLVGAK